jgi:hypothetical protein
MREHHRRKAFGRVALACAAWALLLAVVKFGALWPYQLTRWAMCGAAAWAAFNVRGWRLVVAGVIAVIYNPIDPLAFGPLWRWVNVLTAAGWLVVFPWGEAMNRRVHRFFEWVFVPSTRAHPLRHYLEIGLGWLVLALAIVMIATAVLGKWKYPDPDAQRPNFYPVSESVRKRLEESIYKETPRIEVRIPEKTGE